MTMTAAEVMTLRRLPFQASADTTLPARAGQRQEDGVGHADSISLASNWGGFNAEDFAGVVDRINGTAHQIRCLERMISNLQQDKLRQERLEDDLKIAMDRAAHAEVRALEADNKIKILEARTAYAEDRARQVEKWLMSIRQTVENEFSDISM